MKTASEKFILFVHGSGPLPDKAFLNSYWVDALESGLKRDAPDLLAGFQNTPKEMFYYADTFEDLHPGYDEDLDRAQRGLVLEQLAKYTKAKDFRRRNYEELPGKSPLREFFFDVLASIGVGGLALGRALPELGAYWRQRELRAGLVAELATRLSSALEEDKDVCIVSHCIGSVLVYEALCSVEADHGRLNLWVTMGSPLASNAVRHRLFREVPKFPHNVIAWRNISAEDDYVCHDKTVVDDYRVMLSERVIADISDHTIYNLAIRYGRSDPHHSAGYLAHPRTVSFLSDWLKSASDTS